MADLLAWAVMAGLPIAGWGLAAVSAAAVLPRARLSAAVWLLVAQALLTQVLFDTIW